MFATRIKIMWEEQLVDPPIHYIKDLLDIQNDPKIMMRNGVFIKLYLIVYYEWNFMCLLFEW